MIDTRASFVTISFGGKLYKSVEIKRGDILSDMIFEDITFSNLTK